MPDAPRYKEDLRPELIRGSAVAVAEGTVLASCRVVGRRESVSLVRHNKYRQALVVSADAGGEVCALQVPPNTPLNVAEGVRSLGILRAGEPV